MAEQTVDNPRELRSVDPATDREFENNTWSDSLLLQTESERRNPDEMPHPISRHVLKTSAEVEG